MKTRKLYDFLGKKYLTNMYLDNAWTKHVDRSEKKAVDDIWSLEAIKNKSQIILDLGMGPGRWSKYFVSVGFKKVVGLDQSSRMVVAAREYVDSPRFKAVRADMEKLPFAKESFDKIFCFRAIKYVADRQKVIREVRRVLKPTGTAVLEFSNKSMQNRILKYISMIRIKLNPNLPLESRFRYFAGARFYTKAEVIKLIKLGGLRVISYRYFGLLPSVPLHQGFTWLWIKLDNVLFKILPKYLFSRSLMFLISK